jgi:glyoxylate reductase
VPDKPKAFSTSKLFPPAVEILQRCFDLEFWEKPDVNPNADLPSRLHDKEALICLVADKVNEVLLAASPKLRIVSTVSVGFDHIDVAACTRRKVVATNTPGVLDETTADFAWVLMMAVARRLIEGEQWVRTGQWPGWELDQLVGTDVWGKTLGIVGFGRIGQQMAQRAQGFQMRVLYYNRTRAAADVEARLHAEFVDLDRLLAESDFVTLHVPLKPETRHLMSLERLAKMKRSAFLINAARGPVVDENALVEALEKNLIAGAALDVYEQEPKVHPGLLGRKDVVLAPHLGSASLETRTKMAVMAANNAVTLFEGKQPPNALNPEVLAGS